LGRERTLEKEGEGREEREWKKMGRKKGE